MYYLQHLHLRGHRYLTLWIFVFACLLHTLGARPKASTLQVLSWIELFVRLEGMAHFARGI